MKKGLIGGAVVAMIAGLAGVPMGLMLLLMVTVSGGAGDTPCGPAVATVDGSPTILGPSTIDGERIVAWWQAAGHSRQTPTGVDISVLAGWYIDHGAADGVRGDLAFAQAVVETTQGGLPFNSAAAHRNNFAGIGVTGAGAHGYGFPDPDTGVVAQLQLLREVAVGNGGAFAEPKVAPNWGGRPASTWAGLAGNWAVAPNYWTSISGIYHSMAAGGAPPEQAAAEAGCGPGVVLAGFLSDGDLAPMWAFLAAQLGKPYQWGGTGPDSWDCSGLTMVAWGQVGLQLPRTAAQQYAFTRSVAVAVSDLQPGDLVFWSSGPDPAAIEHVAVYAGHNQVLDAPQTGAVVQVQMLWTKGLYGATRPAALGARPAASG